MYFRRGWLLFGCYVVDGANVLKSRYCKNNWKYFEWVWRQLQRTKTLFAIVMRLIDSSQLQEFDKRLEACRVKNACDFIWCIRGADDLLSFAAALRYKHVHAKAET